MSHTIENIECYLNFSRDLYPRIKYSDYYLNYLKNNFDYITKIYGEKYKWWTDLLKKTMKKTNQKFWPP